MTLESVLIIGEDSPGSLYRSYRRGFESIGVAVSGYCPLTATEAAVPLARTRVTRRLFHGHVTQRLNEQLCDELSTARADLVLVLKGAPLSPATIAHLRKATAAPVVNYYP